jgi:hypothetical protein
MCACAKILLCTVVLLAVAKKNKQSYEYQTNAKTRLPQCNQSAISRTTFNMLKCKIKARVDFRLIIDDKLKKQNKFNISRLAHTDRHSGHQILSGSKFNINKLHVARPTAVQWTLHD